MYRLPGVSSPVSLCAGDFLAGCEEAGELLSKSESSSARGSGEHERIHLPQVQGQWR